VRGSMSFYLYLNITVLTIQYCTSMSDVEMLKKTFIWMIPSTRKCKYYIFVLVRVLYLDYQNGERQQRRDVTLEV
jgi:hypothetical protein